MADYVELRRKFRPVSAPHGPLHPLHRKSSKAAVRAIVREYELKRAELAGSGAPTVRRGPIFHAAVILGLVIVGALVFSASRGSLAFGRKRIERNDLNARKAMDSLSVALGRYRFHVGEYPTTEEGLAVLACRRPEELRRIRRAHPKWDGPYVNHIVKDPWGRDYVYETRPEGGHPILFSMGPDGRMGTSDDVMPDRHSFERAFADTSWTNHWAPAEMRGVVVAPDAETKRRVEVEMRRYD